MVRPKNGKQATRAAAATPAKVAAVLGFAALVIVVFMSSMTKHLANDEHMHVSAGVLASQGYKVYGDFSYLQMPCHPLIYSALFGWSGTTHYLFAARMLSVAAGIVIMLCICSVYRRTLGDSGAAGTLAGLCACTLYVFNPFVNRYYGSASDSDIVIACFVFSFWLFITTDFSRPRKYARIAMIGAVLTLAGCMRLPSFLVHALFLVFIAATPTNAPRERLKSIGVYLAATAAVLIWPVWTIARAPDAFMVNLYELPLIHRLAYRKMGGPIFGKTEMILLSVTLEGGMLIAAAGLYMAAVLAWKRHVICLRRGGQMLLSALVLIAVLVIITLPPTLTLAGVSLLIPSAVIFLAYLLCMIKDLTATTGSGRQFRTAVMVFLACAVTAVAVARRPYRQIARIAEPASWTPMRVHRTAMQIGQRTKEPKLILTLQPIYALEGGCTIYPALSSGLLVYRYADALSDRQRRIARAVGPDTIQRLCERDPPSAVLFDSRRFSGTLLRIVNDKDQQGLWERIDYDHGVVVFFRRDTEDAPDETNEPPTPAHQAAIIQSEAAAST